MAASERGKPERERVRCAGKVGEAAATHGIHTGEDRNQQSLRNGVLPVSWYLGPSEDVEAFYRNRFSNLHSLSLLTLLPHQQFV